MFTVQQSVTARAEADPKNQGNRILVLQTCMTIFGVVHVDASNDERQRHADERKLRIYKENGIYATQEDWLLDPGQDVSVFSDLFFDKGHLQGVKGGGSEGLKQTNNIAGTSGCKTTQVRDTQRM